MKIFANILYIYAPCESGIYILLNIPFTNCENDGNIHVVVWPFSWYLNLIGLLHL